MKFDAGGGVGKGATVTLLVNGAKVAGGRLEKTVPAQFSLGMIIHHTDAEREWAYDRDSHIGRLDKGLDKAKTKGWTIVDMQKIGRSFIRR